MKIDHLRRSLKISRTERKTNAFVREKMGASETIMGRIGKRTLKWFGNVLRMPEDKWPKKIYQWRLPGRRKIGGP